MTHPRRSRAQLAALALAGLFFAAYPAVRPYADETTMAGARAMASGAWIAAHSFAVLGFVLLALALPVLSGLRPDRAFSRGRAVLLATLGTALVLPYYGAESFGLHAIARHVVATDDPALLALTDGVRYQPVAITSFGIGLVLLAVAGALVGVSLWRARAALRWGGLLLATGLVLFLPQFFAPGPLRVTHGVVLAVGCLLLAGAGWRRLGSSTATQDPGQLTGEPPVTPSISAVM
jgi:hypothetical protein